MEIERRTRSSFNFRAFVDGFDFVDVECCCTSGASKFFARFRCKRGGHFYAPAKRVGGGKYYLKKCLVSLAFRRSWVVVLSPPSGMTARDCSNCSSESGDTEYLGRTHPRLATLMASNSPCLIQLITFAVATPYRSAISGGVKLRRFFCLTKGMKKPPFTFLTT